MKYILAVVSALVCVGFVTADHHIPAKTCYSCVKSSLSDCGMNMFNCSNDTFPNIGSDGGDCYTFVGWYWSNNMWMSAAMRGCANCSVADTDFTKEAIKTMAMTNLQWNFNLTFAEISCCNSTNCNTMNLALPDHPSPTEPPSSTPTDGNGGGPDETTKETENGAYSNFLSSFAFVMIAIVLLFK